jgi:hypothetical protein
MCGMGVLQNKGAQAIAFMYVYAQPGKACCHLSDMRPRRVSEQQSRIKPSCTDSYANSMSSNNICQHGTQYMACAASNMHEHATYVAVYQVLNDRACKACKIIEMSHGMYGMALGMQYV